MADGGSDSESMPRPGVEARPRAPRLSYVIGRLDRVVRRELAERLEPLGLTLQQFTALSVIRARPGLSNAQLARRSMITPQSMIAVIRALESQGLVERTASPTNGRILRAVLTQQGDRILGCCEREADGLEAQMTAALSAGQAEDLLGLMRSCVHELGGGL